MVLNIKTVVDLLWITDVRCCDTVKIQYLWENCKKIFYVMIIVKNAIAITFTELNNVVKPQCCGG